MHHFDLSAITLSVGDHATREEGMCLLEAVAWWADEEYTDQPECVASPLVAFGQNLNDHNDNRRRQELVRFIPLLPGTADDGLDETRGYLALDWLTHVYFPMWLNLAGHMADAAVFRALPPIRDKAAVALAESVLTPVLLRVHREDASEGAVWRVGTSRRDAAGAEEQAWWAAKTASRIAGGRSAVEAAHIALWDEDVELLTHMSPSLSPLIVRALARGTDIEPTVDTLWRSALDLFDTMIHPESAVMAP